MTVTLLPHPTVELQHLEPRVAAAKDRQVCGQLRLLKPVASVKNKDIAGVQAGNPRQRLRSACIPETTCPAVTLFLSTRAAGRACLYAPRTGRDPLQTASGCRSAASPAGERRATGLQSPLRARGPPGSSHSTLGITSASTQRQHRARCATRADAIAALVGVHPKFTQEPPSRSRSAKATRLPALARACASGTPACPPPADQDVVVFVLAHCPDS